MTARLHVAIFAIFVGTSCTSSGPPTDPIQSAIDAGNWELAIDELEGTLAGDDHRTKDETTQVRLQLVECLIRSERDGEAVEHSATLLEECAISHEALQSVCVSFVAEEFYAAAIQLLELAFGIFPERSEEIRDSIAILKEQKPRMYNESGELAGDLGCLLGGYVR